MIFVGGAARAQEAALLPPLRVFRYQLPVENTFNGISKSITIPVTAIPGSAFYTGNLGFFCRQELKWDKVTTIPFRFRLGSVEQCDFLEGKRRFR